MKISSLMRKSNPQDLSSVFVFASDTDDQTYGLTWDDLVASMTTAIGGSFVAGADTQIQYNNNGAFAADPNLAWDYNAQILAISGAVTATTFNGVALSNVGVATNFLDETGNYSTPPSAVPGGSNTHVQFNNNGSFDGSSLLTWDGATLAVTGAVTANSFAGNLTGNVTGDLTGNVTGDVNGVTLTNGGAATDFLDAQGNYSAIASQVAGANTEIQFNNAGVFGSSSSLTWNGTTLNATQFNGVALTTGGAATQYLNGAGGYTTPPDTITNPAGADTQLQFNNSGSFGASASLTWNGTTLNATQFNGVALTTAGAATDYLDAQGNYTAPPSANPAGADTQIQFNNSGSFGANAALTWNGTTLNATQFNGVALTAAGVATNFLNETGAYSEPDFSKVVFSQYIEGTTVDPLTTAETPGAAPVLAEMTYTFTPQDANNDIEVFFSGSFENSGKGANGCQVGVFIGGILQGNTEREQISGNSVNERGTVGTLWKGKLPASSQTVDIRFWAHDADVFGINTQRALFIREIAP